MPNASPAITWLPEPEEHDYPAALSYLNLIFDDEGSARYIDKLKGAPVRTYKAKDIFRASGLGLLGVSNSHVVQDGEKIDAGKPLSPLLLVRQPGLGKVIIADGYHRLCAVYARDEDAVIPCKLI